LLPPSELPIGLLELPVFVASLAALLLAPLPGVGVIANVSFYASISLAVFRGPSPIDLQ
jgi:hypothetical protein